MTLNNCSSIIQTTFCRSRGDRGQAVGGGEKELSRRTALALVPLTRYSTNMLASTSKVVLQSTRRALSSSCRSLSSPTPSNLAANAAKVVVSPTPTVATSTLLLQTREEALWTPGLLWRDEEVVEVGAPPRDAAHLVEADLQPVEEGGRETTKMK